MEPRKMVLVLLQLVGYGAVEGLDIICQIQLQLPIESALAEKLPKVVYFLELSRIETIKRSNSSADVLLTIVLPFNVTAQSVQQKLSERINIVLRDNVLDGVDLDFDIALLDYYEQLRYGQFLRRLRSILSDKYTISTTIGCYTMGSSKTLLKAFNDHVNLVSVVGVNMLEDELVDRSKEEFMLREYGTDYITRLLQDGLQAEKIVLSVLTVGIVFNPSNYRMTRSLHRGHIGVLSYGQICELLQEKQSKCGSRTSSKRPACSLFAGNGAIVYDSDKTVEERVLQAYSLGVRGVLILPNYDDSDDICNQGAFPLFRSLLDAVASTSDDRAEIVCDTKQRYGDTEDRSIYYTYNSGRFQRNRCADGTHFNESLQRCTNDEFSQTTLMDKRRVATSESPAGYSSTELSAESTDTSAPNSEVLETVPPYVLLEQSFKSATNVLESALTYLDSIISKVLSLMVRMESLEQALRDGTMSPASSQAAEAPEAYKNVPFETFPNQRVVSLVDSPYVAEFLHHLYGYRVRYGPHLHRYALLIGTIETVVYFVSPLMTARCGTRGGCVPLWSSTGVLSVYALLTQAGWNHRLEWRPLWHIPKYLRINFALAVSLLTIYSNLAAIVGLFTHRTFLLWPYMFLHLGTFALELWYLMGRKLTTLPSVCLRKFDPNVCQNETDKWWSPLMVFLLGFHLSIVIAVYLHVDGLNHGEGTVHGMDWSVMGSF
uniref:GH18 domain-containing protein n=1 Tax=Anopheles culicifacies TaxID=139723 RepID=A0A182MIC5_9DIPT